MYSGPDDDDIVSLRTMSTYISAVSVCADEPGLILSFCLETCVEIRPFCFQVIVFLFDLVLCACVCVCVCVCVYLCTHTHIYT